MNINICIFFYLIRILLNEYYIICKHLIFTNNNSNAINYANTIFNRPIFIQYQWINWSIL